jgi:uncharacterized membrane-anchored protein
MSMKTRNIYKIVIGTLMLISGLTTILITEGEGIIGTILLCAGLAFLITGIIRHQKYGDEPESDERSKKIGAYGITYAWLTGLIFMTGLFWIDYLGALKLSVQTALSASILVLALSAVIYQMYLFRKGDVE